MSRPVVIIWFDVINEVGPGRVAAPRVGFEHQVGELFRIRTRQSRAFPGGFSVRRYRYLILGPLAIALVALSLLFVAAIFWVEGQNLDKHFQDTFTAVGRSYTTALDADSDMLRAVLRVLEDRSDLKETLARRDREALAALSQPLFAHLRDRHRITHFYFHDVAGVNFLRAHQPERHGDVIDRETMRAARESGNIAWGVELGPLGTFTLRVVSPWRDAEGNIIAYLELGEEIDHIIARLHEDLQVDLFVFIRKDRVDMEDWQSGMLMLGRPADWEQFSDAVLVSGTSDEKETAFLQTMLDTANPSGTPLLAEITHKGFRAASFPLIDASQREVGRMGVVLDQTEQITSARRVIFGILAAALVGSTGLWFIFFQILRRIEKRLAVVSNSRDRYQDKSRRDGLTGLLNHNEFYRQLRLEVERSKRYGEPLAVLMLDLDHFKQVNDSHGHPVGDEVLRGTANLLRGLARSCDVAARYGGEEFALILPHTTVAAAHEVAERIRVAAGEQVFESAAGSFSIKLSAGVAGYPANTESAEDLLSNADSALYTAKRSGRNRSVRFDEIPESASSETRQAGFLRRAAEPSGRS